MHAQINYKMCAANYYPNYRVEGKVKHCRIEVEDDQYMLASVAFDNLTELVQYYEMNPVFRGKSL